MKEITHKKLLEELEPHIKDQCSKVFYYHFADLDQLVDDFLEDAAVPHAWLIVCDPNLDITTECKTLNAWYRQVKWSVIENDKHKLIRLETLPI